MPTIATLPTSSSVQSTDRFPVDHDNGDGTFTTQQATGAQLTTLLSSAGTYVFNQATPLATWTITHGLNRFPSATVVDSTGTQVEGDVVYNSSNQVTLSFGGAFSGVAYLN
jgi:hypothetical protein